MLFSWNCHQIERKDPAALLRAESQGQDPKRTEWNLLMAVTININGFDTVKWKKIKLSLNNDTNIIALQETHCNTQRAKDMEIHWSNNWIAYWGFSNTGREGVAILARKNIYTQIEELLPCNSNMVGILVKDKHRVTQQWWSVYVPCSHSNRKHIWNWEINNISKEVYVGGDWNTHMSPKAKAYSAPEADRFNRFAHRNRLVDINNGMLTYHKGEYHSTLNRWMVRGRWTKTYQKQGPSDHDMLFMEIHNKEKRQFWRCNTSLLKNEEFNIQMRKIVETEAKQHNSPTLEEWKQIKDTLHDHLKARGTQENTKKRERKPWLKNHAEEDL